VGKYFDDEFEDVKFSVRYKEKDSRLSKRDQLLDGKMLMEIREYFETIGREDLFGESERYERISRVEESIFGIVYTVLSYPALGSDKANSQNHFERHKPRETKYFVTPKGFPWKNSGN
jgi:hypothetical protein